MNEDRIIESLKAAIATVLTTQAPENITPQDSLRQMGANSLDRAEILMCTMEELNVRLPMLAFASAQNLGDIVEVLAGALQQARKN
jgi:polyketide biosynthesis acyl carrier protein